MKTISCDTIRDTVRELFLAACNRPNKDVVSALQKAHREERVPHAREILRQLCENNRIAIEEGIPACQDTGLAVVMIDLGQDVHITGGFLEIAVNEGVRDAYKQGYFRKSVLDPLTRINTQDNTPAVLHTRIIPGGDMIISALPKGFGSENMSQIKMLRPSDGKEGIVHFVVQTARQAGGSPCPPVILGIGIGGTFESSALLSKRQLVREVGSRNPDPELAAMETEIKEKINSLGIGPMGLSGDCYCLATHIAKVPTHIAGLPVAVNYCCHMLRHKTAIL
jgi:fumarate hydratase subunit alpha